MFEPRVAVASLSGESDAAWASAAAEHVGAAFLGGIALCEPARGAAREMVNHRDRNEFLPDDPIAFVGRELSKLEGEPLLTGFNVRTTEREPLRRVARLCRDHGAVVEINAHCRQDELCAVGCGERLLADTDRLASYVSIAANTGATVSVKLRAEVPGIDLVETAQAVAKAGASILHVDAMDSEAIIRELAPIDAFLLANNGVRDRATVREYLDYGADGVSVGRPSDKPRVLDRVRDATDEWFREHGREVTA